MNIVHVIGTLALGGIELRLLHLVRTQVKDPEIKKITIISFNKGVLYEKYKSISSVNIIILNKNSLIRQVYVLKELLSINADIVHCYNFSAIASTLIASYTIRKSKFIYHYGGLSSLFNNITLFIERYLLNPTAFTVYNSDSTKEVFKHFNVARKKSKVIVNGFDLNFTPLENTAEVEEKLSFLCVSRLTKNKNIVAHILFIKGLIEDGINLHLDIIGDGVEREELSRLVNKLNLSRYITFHGYIENPFKHEFIKKANFLLSFSYSETFGLSVLEAMSVGIIPIVSSVGGMPTLQRIKPSGMILNSTVKIENSLKQHIPVKMVWNSYFNKITDIHDVDIQKAIIEFITFIKNTNMSEVRGNAINSSRLFTLEQYQKNVKELYNEISC